MARTVSDAYITKESARTLFPSEIYNFTIGVDTFHYTSGDVNLTVSGTLYVPATINRNNITQTDDLNPNNVTISCSLDTEPFADLLSTPAQTLVLVEISRVFRDQSPIEKSIRFSGKVLNMSFKGNHTIEINCGDHNSFFTQEIPRYRVSPRCNNMLYDTYCSVNANNYDASATLSTVSASGLTLTSTTFDAQADNYYRFGRVYFNGHYRGITGHEGENITIRYKIPGLDASDVVTVWAGCDRWIDTCIDKFNNGNNYFGHLFVPGHNPVTIT